jgi:hypothetical protein
MIFTPSQGKQKMSWAAFLRKRAHRGEKLAQFLIPDSA